MTDSVASCLISTSESGAGSCDGTFKTENQLSILSAQNSRRIVYFLEEITKKPEKTKNLKMDFEYQTGSMSEYSYVETYLIRNGYEKVVTKLQNLKPIIVYDYLKENGYHEVAKEFGEAILEEDQSDL